jgi:signal transduction histidine kinase/CHASE3 domain sensor protein
MNRRRTDILIRATLIVALLVVCLNAWLAFRSVKILNDSQYWVAQTWQVIDTLERVIGSLKSAETGYRGFLVTGDSAYLAPYKSAVQEIPREFDELTSLTVDNPKRQDKIAAMRALVDKRIAVLQSAMGRLEAGEKDKTGLLKQSGTGKAELDQLRAMTTSMQREEQRLLVQRVAESHRARADSQLTILVVTVVDILLIALVLWLLNRERVLRRRTAATADRLAKLQSVIDVGLTKLSLAELIHSLLDRLGNVIGADGSVFCHWRDGEIEVAESSGVKATIGKRFKLEPGNPLYEAGSSRKLVTVEGGSAEIVPLEGMRREMHAILVLPILVSGEVAALLIAGRRENAFVNPDEDLLTFVADRIGMALDRAKIYEDEREARRLAEQSTAEVQLLNEELEERVQLRTAELAASNRELEAFSYSVSHDLRAPLRSIDGFSLALEEDFAHVMNAEGRDYIRRIRSGVQKMGQLIDALLQLSRITRSDLSREQVNISEIAADVARDLRAENPDRNLVFRIEPDLEANADPGLLRVALENLLGNAVKFSAHHSEALIEFGRSPETGEFFVRDNGAGFDMQYVDKLFHAFQRLHGERDFKGSGIGLATVSRVIQRHQGKIRAEGAVDQGATFWFTLG